MLYDRVAAYEESRLRFAMALHERVGEGTAAGAFPVEVMQMVLHRKHFPTIPPVDTVMNGGH